MNKKVIRIPPRIQNNNQTNKAQQGKRVCIYARVSKNSDALERSLENQINYFERLIKNNPNWTLAGIYKDDGISGTQIKGRHQFQTMIASALQGNIDMIITKSITRFARNTLDLISTVRKLKEAGVEVFFEKENIRTLSPDGELLLTILAAFAQAEAVSISENVKWKKIKDVEMGKDQYHELFGYDYIEGKYIINQKEASIVREIYKRFLAGENYSHIAQTLSKRGIKTRKNNLFNYPQVKKILKNEKYAGYTIYQKYFSEDPITHRQVLNTGQLPKYLIKGTHPAIISYKDYADAQKIIEYLSLRFNHKGKNIYKADTIHMSDAA